MSKFTFLKSDRSNIQSVLITGVFFITISILDVFLKKYFNTKIVINLFFSLEELERRMPNKFHLKNADLITCSGKAQIDYLSQYIRADKLAYLPLGIDTKSFSPSSGKVSRDKNLVICLHCFLGCCQKVNIL